MEIFQEYDDRKFQFTLYCVYFALILIELILTSFVEKQQRRGYQALGRVSILLICFRPFKCHDIHILMYLILLV